MPYLYYTNDFALNFNIGENVNENCAQGNAIAIDSNGKCTVYGNKDKYYARSFQREIGSGLLLTYIGDACEINPKFHNKINFYIICDKRNSDFKLIEYDQCEINMKIYSPAGCKTKIENGKNLIRVLW